MFVYLLHHRTQNICYQKAVHNSVNLLLSWMNSCNSNRDIILKKKIQYLLISWTSAYINMKTNCFENIQQKDFRIFFEIWSSSYHFNWQYVRFHSIGRHRTFFCWALNGLFELKPNILPNKVELYIKFIQDVHNIEDTLLFRLFNLFPAVTAVIAFVEFVLIDLIRTFIE